MCEDRRDEGDASTHKIASFWGVSSALMQNFVADRERMTCLGNIEKLSPLPDKDLLAPPKGLISRLFISPELSYETAESKMKLIPENFVGEDYASAHRLFGML